MNKVLGPRAREIIALKPRAWEHWLFSQVFADLIAEVKGEGAWEANSRANFVYNSQEIDSLTAFNAWAKAQALALSRCLADFNECFVEPLRAASGPIGVPGNVDALIAVATELSKVYLEVHVLARHLDYCTWSFAEDFPSLSKDAFEAVYYELLDYLKDESRRLLVHFEQYGSKAVEVVSQASAKLEQGQDPGRIDAYLIKFSFRPFDDTNVNLLIALIDHVVNIGTETGMSGFVYLLTNRSMPGLVKIGHTTRASGDRIAELSKATGVPTPFELVFDQFVADSAQAERLIHESLAAYRVAANREFSRSRRTLRSRPY